MERPAIPSVMDSQHDLFWQALRAKATDKEGYAPMSEAEVEKVLGECGEERLSEEEIDGIVVRATGLGLRMVVGEEKGEGGRRWRRWLKVAGVVLGVILAAAAVFVLTAPGWFPTTAWWSGRGMKAVPFVSYVETLVDTRHRDDVRLSAMGRLLGCLRISARELRGLREEGDLKEQAAAWLERLLALTDDRNTEVLSSDDLEEQLGRAKPINQLLKGMLDDSKSITTRHRYLDAVGNQAQCGILALKRVSMEPNSRLTKNCRVLLDRHLRKYLR